MAEDIRTKAFSLRLQVAEAVDEARQIATEIWSSGKDGEWYPCIVRVVEQIFKHYNCPLTSSLCKTYESLTASVSCEDRSMQTDQAVDVLKLLLHGPFTERELATRCELLQIITSVLEECFMKMNPIVIDQEQKRTLLRALWVCSMNISTRNVAIRVMSKLYGSALTNLTAENEAIVNRMAEIWIENGSATSDIGFLNLVNSNYKHLFDATVNPNTMVKVLQGEHLDAPLLWQVLQSTKEVTNASKWIQCKLSEERNFEEYVGILVLLLVISKCPLPGVHDSMLNQLAITGTVTKIMQKLHKFPNLAIPSLPEQYTQVVLTAGTFPPECSLLPCGVKCSGSLGNESNWKEMLENSVRKLEAVQTAQSMVEVMIEDTPESVFARARAVSCDENVEKLSNNSWQVASITASERCLSSYVVRKPAEGLDKRVSWLLFLEYVDAANLTWIVLSAYVKGWTCIKHPKQGTLVKDLLHIIVTALDTTDPVRLSALFNIIMQIQLYFPSHRGSSAASCAVRCVDQLHLSVNPSGATQGPSWMKTLLDLEQHLFSAIRGSSIHNEMESLFGQVGDELLGDEHKTWSLAFAYLAANASDSSNYNEKLVGLGESIGLHGNELDQTGLLAILVELLLGISVEPRFLCQHFNHSVDVSCLCAKRIMLRIWNANRDHVLFTGFSDDATFMALWCTLWKGAMVRIPSSELFMSEQLVKNIMQAMRRHEENTDFRHVLVMLSELVVLFGVRYSKYLESEVRMRCIKSTFSLLGEYKKSNELVVVKNLERSLWANVQQPGELEMIMDYFLQQKPNTLTVQHRIRQVLRTDEQLSRFKEISKGTPWEKLVCSIQSRSGPCSYEHSGDALASLEHVSICLNQTCHAQSRLLEFEPFPAPMLLTMWMSAQRNPGLTSLLRKSYSAVLHFLESSVGKCERDCSRGYRGVSSSQTGQSESSLAAISISDALPALVSLFADQRTPFQNLVALCYRFCAGSATTLVLARHPLVPAASTSNLALLAKHLCGEPVHVDLTGVGLNPRRCAILSGWLSRNGCAIKTLELERNEIGAKGLTIIADALRCNTRLASLGLSSNQLCDGGNEGCGMIALAEALVWSTSLVRLNLSHNQLSRDGLHALLRAINVNSSLQAVQLEGTCATAVQVAAVTHRVDANAGKGGARPCWSNRVLAGSQLSLWENQTDEEHKSDCGTSTQGLVTMEDTGTKDIAKSTRGPVAMEDCRVTKNAVGVSEGKEGNACCNENNSKENCSEMQRLRDELSELKAQLRDTRYKEAQLERNTCKSLRSKSSNS